MDWPVQTFYVVLVREEDLGTWISIARLNRGRRHVASRSVFSNSADHPKRAALKTPLPIFQFTTVTQPRPSRPPLLCLHSTCTTYPLLGHIICKSWPFREDRQCGCGDSRDFSYRGLRCKLGDSGTWYRSVGVSDDEPHSTTFHHHPT